MAKNQHSIVFLRNAIQEIDKCISKMKTASADDAEMAFRLEEAFALLSKAWHVRDLTMDEFDELADEEIMDMRISVPDLSSVSNSFRVVDRNFFKRT